MGSIFSQASQHGPRIVKGACRPQLGAPFFYIQFPSRQYRAKSPAHCVFSSLSLSNPADQNEASLSLTVEPERKRWQSITLAYITMPRLAHILWRRNGERGYWRTQG